MRVPRPVVSLSLVLGTFVGACQLSVPTASPSADASTSFTDLSAIACATDDPADVGELTGAWAGSDGGVYYIRHVGDCVWWFGTELDGH